MILLLLTLSASCDHFSKLGENMKRGVMRFCTPKEQFNLHLTRRLWSQFFNYRNVCDSDDAIAVTVLQEKQSGAYVVQYNERHINKALALALVMMFKTDTWKWKYIFQKIMIIPRICGALKLLQQRPKFARELGVLAISHVKNTAGNEPIPSQSQTGLCGNLRVPTESNRASQRRFSGLRLDSKEK